MTHRWRRQKVRWKPKRRRMGFQTLAIFGLLAFAIGLNVVIARDKWPALREIGALSWLDRSAPRPQVIQRSSVTSGLRVIDGDTVASAGDHYRLVGFDTPEKDGLARCESERRLAERAAARLNELIADGTANLARVGCACRPGTEGTKRCNHGRLCGVLTIDGRDAGDILISEGLAHRYVCSGDHCPRRPGWC